MLYIIGLGLSDEKDVSVKGLEIIQKAKEVYLEEYTSVMQVTKEKLENFYGKKIISADREFVEKQIETVFKKAKKEDIAFLVKGDAHTATTHVDIYLRARKQKIPIKTIFGPSILSAVGITGLSLYNFGRVISIPFHYENLESAYKHFLTNKKNGMHSLFLLDLDPRHNKYLSIKEALNYLKNKGLNENTFVVGCARIGSYDQIIKAGKLKDTSKIDFGNPPYCIIVPGKLHFIEEEALQMLDRV